MPTIAELKEKLKKLGKPVSGSKAELLSRLGNVKIASIKSKQSKKPKIPINFNKIQSHPLAIFYITLYFQNPNSKMAKNWIKSQGLSHKDAKHFYNKIMN